MRAYMAYTEANMAHGSTGDQKGLDVNYFWVDEIENHYRVGYMRLESPEQEIEGHIQDHIYMNQSI